jgi:hypothetical protein
LVRLFLCLFVFIFKLLVFLIILKWRNECIRLVERKSK